MYNAIKYKERKNSFKYLEIFKQKLEKFTYKQF